MPRNRPAQVVYHVLVALGGLVVDAVRAGADCDAVPRCQRAGGEIHRLDPGGRWNGDYHRERGRRRETASGPLVEGGLKGIAGQGLRRRSERRSGGLWRRCFGIVLCRHEKIFKGDVVCVGHGQPRGAKRPGAHQRSPDGSAVKQERNRG